MFTFYKAKHALTIQSRNHTLSYLPTWVENLCAYKNVQVMFKTPLLFQKVEAAKMSFNRWMAKQTMVYPSNGILLSDKKKWATEPWNIMKET